MARKRNQVKSFTKTGRSAPGTLGSGKTASLGHFDPTTGQVYQHPRVRADKGIGGGSVRVTNPAAADPKVRERTSSLGMGNVGQRGRNMDPS